VKLSYAQKNIRNSADAKIAEHSQQFFKTGKGEYGEGDKFLGIRVPVLRKFARQYRDLSFKETESLLGSRFHEERLCALLILVLKYSKGTYEERETIYRLYLKNTRFINNWDLVDSSAHHIVGEFLAESDKSPLYKLAKSRSLWERRIAIIATYHFIKNGQFNETLKISKMLLGDSEDLIHKAVGWMLREVGNRDRATEVAFLQVHYKTMPRTMLRYAIEKFPERQRQRYLRGSA
jgi:3-methyladenine DNA glycosylase AlkD